MDILVPAFLLGVILSLVLIGPVFFLLIETSILKGWKAALVLNFGVLTADILCIIISYYSSKDLGGYIESHPSLYRIGGFVIFIYGLFMFLSKPKLHMDNAAIVSPNYFKTFYKGFLLNLLNIGVIFFWFTVVSSIAIKYTDSKDFILFMIVVLLTFFGIDLIKIFLAQLVQGKLTDKRVFVIRRIIGIALMVFGVIFFMKSYGILDEIDKEINNELKIDEKIK